MPHTPNIHQNDEVDLVELFHKLWMKKWLVIGATAVITIIATVYAYFTPPVYRAQVFLMPPSLSDIAGFNLARNMSYSTSEMLDTDSGRNSAPLESFTTKDVYGIFVRNLQSDHSKRLFYRNVYLPSLREEEKKGAQDSLYRDFLRRVSITTPTSAQPDRFVLNIDGLDPAQVAEWAKQYIQDVEQRSLEEMLENTQSEIQVRRRNLMQQINILRESAKARREDRIVQLREALSIAQAIGLENPPVIAAQTNDQLSVVMDGNLTYMRGAKALRAEIEILKKRNSDDPFIPGLRFFQEQYSFYTSLNIQSERVGVFRLDGSIRIPEQPIKPQKGLIISLGAFFGLILGGGIGLASVFIEKRKLKVI